MPLKKSYMATETIGNDLSEYTNALLRRQCTTAETHGENMGLRISSIFVVFIASFIGVMTPLVASRVQRVSMPTCIYFFARYFGSGVIVATAFIHLLYEAHRNLSSPCLSDAFQDFPYAFGIALVGIFGTFLIELVTKYQLSSSDNSHPPQAHTHGPSALTSNNTGLFSRQQKPMKENSVAELEIQPHGEEALATLQLSTAPGQGEPTQTLPTSISAPRSIHSDSPGRTKLSNQIGSICLLEFGIVFHSIFVGLTVAVSGPEFTTLYPVIVFHQMFEGLGLGTRLESTPWSASNEWISWLFAVMFSVTTPLGIAVGLGIRTSFELNSPRALITTGIFDAISAGILIYTGLVELMGSEFLHSDEFKQAPLKRVLGAYSWMGLGAALMALLGAWA